MEHLERLSKLCREKRDYNTLPVVERLQGIERCDRPCENDGRVCNCKAIADGAREIERLRAALDYLLGERSNLHPMLGGVPTIRDLCFNAFMKAKDKNDEDGGNTDWFNDTLPLVSKGIEKMRAEFICQQSQRGIQKNLSPNSVADPSDSETMNLQPNGDCK